MNWYKKAQEDGSYKEYKDGKYTVKVWDTGDKSWYFDGKLHREDGPAIEWADGERSWYIDGELHREDGPAYEYPNGNKSWYLNNINYTKEGYLKEIKRRSMENEVSVEQFLQEIR